MGPTQETGPCDEPIEDIDCVLGSWEAGDAKRTHAFCTDEIHDMI